MDDFQQKSDAFIEWLAVLPGVTINPKIAVSDLRDRGVGRSTLDSAIIGDESESLDVAVEDIQSEDEELFSIPSSCVMSAESSDLVSKLPDVFQELDSWLALVLVLMYEYLKPNSFWKPYLDILPRTFETLMFWNRKELEELQASAVVNKIGKGSAEASFKLTVLPAIKSNTDTFYADGIPHLSDEELMSLSHRMASLIMAYAFDLEKDDSQIETDEDGFATDEDEESMLKAMVPLADMLNADVDFNARLYREEGVFSMRTLRPIQKGEEVLNDYGPLPRSDLVRRYGYLTPAYAIHDVVEIPRKLVLEKLDMYHKLEPDDIEARIAHLEDKDLLEDAYLLARHPESTFPDSLKTLITTFLAEDRHGYRHLGNLTLEPRGKMTRQFADIAYNVVSARMGQYSTSLAHDRALLRGQNLTGRSRMAVEIRVGEKEILAETLAYAIQLQRDSVGNAEENSGSKRQKLEA